MLNYTDETINKGDQNVKKAGLAIMLELSAVNTSYAFLTAHLAIKQTGDINPQISDAHMMETYLAIVNSLK